ncbi:MFS transporter [Bradyrhizobium nitroreducens]|uniref:MFS transporter n=1 Tax=Bradyrhizobium nitroreducens TaxID=709803 RepID=A0A2M6UP35_9BRAD|nr:MFS transporter [Bradyrhizobium nitroreducens]PIT06351.1 MFS transporter [Bradyrhizobium nitroreducens]
MTDDVADQWSVRTPSIAKVAWASVLGTAIEWYDFLIYGTAAALVFNKLFFPAFDPLIGTVAAFGTYAVGFVARPIGGAIIGHFGDRIGRKSMLVATLLMMGIGTFLIGCLPTYEEVGIWAPIMLVALRFVQGIGIGGEWSGAVTMMIEHAGKRRGFWGSLVQVGFPMGVAASTGIFALVTQLPEASFLSWGWRVPFLLSIVLVLVGLFARYSLTETPEFRQVLERKDVVSQPIFEIFRRDWRNLLLAIGITVSEVGLAYLLTVFVITYSTTKLGMPRQTVLNSVVYAALVEFVTLPLAGWLSDIYGRKTLYLAGAIASIVMAFPLFWLLDTKDATIVTLALIVTMTLTHALLFGPKAAYMPELFGTRLRYSGASLGANIAAALSGGLSPLIATALLVWTGGAWAISIFIIALSMLTLVSVLAAPETARLPLKY